MTVSAVECVIDDDKPPVKSSRSSSRDDPQRSSTDSSCSSSGSSGKGESVVNNRRSDLQNKVGSEERERAKVIIKKQMAERKKSSNEKQESKIAEIQKVEGVAGRRKAENERNAPEEKRPLPSVSRFRAAREQVLCNPHVTTLLDRYTHTEAMIVTIDILGLKKTEHGFILTKG